MAENAAAWGKEKAELLVRLHEKTNSSIRCASCQMTKMIDNATVGVDMTHGVSARQSHIRNITLCECHSYVSHFTCVGVVSYS